MVWNKSFEFELVHHVDLRRCPCFSTHIPTVIIMMFSFTVKVGYYNVYYFTSIIIIHGPNSPTALCAPSIFCEKHYDYVLVWSIYLSPIGPHLWRCCPPISLKDVSCCYTPFLAHHSIIALVHLSSTHLAICTLPCTILSSLSGLLSWILVRLRISKFGSRQICRWRWLSFSTQPLV